MQLDTGIYGAKRQSFEKVSPRSILLACAEQYPNESEDKLFEIVFERLSEQPDAIRAVATYWFTNEFRRLSKPTAPPLSMAARANVSAATITERLRDHIDQQVGIVLSNMLMPSGKPLCESDKAECSKAGGWLAKIADRLSEGQRVRDVFNEDQLRALYEGREG